MDSSSLTGTPVSSARGGTSVTSTPVQQAPPALWATAPPSRSRILNDLGRLESRLRVTTLQNRKESFRLLFVMLAYFILSVTVYLVFKLMMPTFYDRWIPWTMLISYWTYFLYLFHSIFQRFRLHWTHVERANRALRQFGLEYVDSFPLSVPQVWTSAEISSGNHTPMATPSAASLPQTNPCTATTPSQVPAKRQDFLGETPSPLQKTFSSMMTSNVNKDDKPPMNSTPSTPRISQIQDTPKTFVIATTLDRARAVFAPSTLPKSQFATQKQLKIVGSTPDPKLFRQRGYLDLDLRQLRRVLVRNRTQPQHNNNTTNANNNS